MIDTNWTIAYRKPRANRFERVSELAVEWVDAMAWARAVAQVHPELDIWCVPTAAAEDRGYSCDEDKGNILTGTGRRVRVLDTGSLAALGMELADEGTTVEFPFADGEKRGTATYRLPAGTDARKALTERAALDSLAHAARTRINFDGKVIEDKVTYRNTTPRRREIDAMNDRNRADWEAMEGTK